MARRRSKKSLIREGHNRIALAGTPALECRVRRAKTLVRGVLVRQSVWARTATLLGYAEGRPDLSVLPELSLRGALWAQFQSISRPVSLCERKRDLDPSPCIAVSDVTLDNPFAYLDKGGAFHFRDNVGMGDVIALSSNSNFLLPVRIGGQPAVSLVWGLFYERPEDLVFSGLPPGGAGPSLHIRVERPTATRFVFTRKLAARPVRGRRGGSRTVRDFHIVSRGAMGFTGAYGSSGSSGMSGSQCSDGGRGGDGGSGGNGGPGGNGGDIVVEVACGGAPCPDTVALLQTIILSMGGPGGPGGSGGSGGPGGAGGSGRSPSTHIDSDGNSVTDDPGCSPGASGSSGANGSDGWPGPPGRAGRITFSVVP
jgi:hypothetical protein